MKLLSWSIEEDISNTTKKAKFLIDLSKKYNVELNFIGQGIKYTCLKDKIFTLRDYIEQLDENELILCIDAYDTLINKSLEDIEIYYNKTESEIIISTEKMFTYHWEDYKHKYESINSSYKYLNSGVILGKVKFIKTFLDEVIELSKTAKYETKIDQGLVGIWAGINFNNNKRLKLDINCDLAWTTSGEYDKLIEISKNNPIITNPESNSIPYIIHCPGSGSEICQESLSIAYNNICNRFK